MDEMENFDDVDVGENAGEEVPVCLKCLAPVNRLDYYCPHCNEACNLLTPYLPFKNISWAVTVWGRMWRQVWSRDVSAWGRIFRLFMIVWKVPILLVGLLFKKTRKEEDFEK